MEKKKPAKKKVAKKVTKKATKKVAKKVSKPIVRREVRVVNADNLPDAIRQIAEDLAEGGFNIEEMFKPKAKLKEGSPKALRLDAEWDEYAKGVRSEMTKMASRKEKLTKGDGPLKLAMLGAQIDHTWRTAKTSHIKHSMLELGIDVVTFLNDLPLPEGLPEELVAMKRKSAESVVVEYKRQLELLDAPARKAEEKKEREFVSAPAGGIFANVSVDDILNAPKRDDLPDF